MPERATPPFRADHVGSLIRPDALIAARQAAERNDIPAAELRRIQEDAIRDVVRLQEEIGFRLVTDGEFNASLRAGDDVETITPERAAELLAARREAGPAKKRKSASRRKS